ncbi:putative protein kinase CAMK-CDPK family [Helianthus annuus]|nr:putative protein kinase CAMK-CDPK family [Helianthus annuus]KAJ0632750.1 putative protein kinase CAMK-CDPK family [Helianthus annuus]
MYVVDSRFRHWLRRRPNDDPVREIKGFLKIVIAVKYVLSDFLTPISFQPFFLLLQKMILPVAVEDVKREIKILRVLSGHENVVQLYNAFEDDSYVYIAMELCEGG